MSDQLRRDHRIRLKIGAPPLEELRAEYRLRRELPLHPSSYHYEPYIGKKVEDLLDALNEERQLILNGETDPADLFGLYVDEPIEEGATDEQPEPYDDLRRSRWELVLVDSQGVVWSTLDDPKEDQKDDAAQSG